MYQIHRPIILSIITDTSEKNKANKITRAGSQQHPTEPAFPKYGTYATVQERISGIGIRNQMHSFRNASQGMCHHLKKIPLPILF